MNQSGFDFHAALEFVENPEPRCPCTLLLDVSGSMRKQGRIGALNQGLQTFRDQMLTNSLAARRVELSVVTFSDRITIVQDFVTVDQFQPPTLTAGHETYLGEGVIQSLDLLETRKEKYRRYGVSYYQPWLFLITDGSPHGGFTAIVQQAAERIQQLEQERKLAFFAVGVAEANMEILSKLSVRPPVRLIGLEFDKLFVWLSASMQSASHSVPMDEGPPRSTTDWTPDKLQFGEFDATQQTPFSR